MEPDLISTPDELLNVFALLGINGGDNSPTFCGFDVEWGDDDGGAELLQLATTQRVALIDIPALSMTKEGAYALKETVGKLFANPSIWVVGFVCRQDMTRLRSSQCVLSEHWLGPTEAIVDVQTVVGKANPKLRVGIVQSVQSFSLEAPGQSRTIQFVDGPAAFKGTAGLCRH